MWPMVFDPFRELQDIERRIGAVLSANKPTAPVKVESFTPAVNERVDEKGYYLEIDLPGVKKEDIDISVNDGVLVISGERKLEKKEEKPNYTRIESFFGRFERAFKLPADADLDNIEAKYEDGVLKVFIPKKQKPAGKKIEVK
ncbi:Hsp20/alpha crystallin family protein [Caminibacter mediatlanticus TB-2]|uniref:Heat shock protein Hsp20 n=1 Tax=Caminibacter mediatlanticus TB-2 TaxID=391592 RepID=A0AAI9F244_9BACT|nr:Hsp20/alpha crystallin family protein [Caminibacter mediatlanticus]EDM23211.1 Heat shock protein Hsp20 [Caminibacter mediatlanticus TB-2]QCT93909.1 Hsp20/alpha crystallin family protein [Caminibacter mediatlanticus TB-2]